MQSDQKALSELKFVSHENEVHSVDNQETLGGGNCFYTRTD